MGYETEGTQQPPSELSPCSSMGRLCLGSREVLEHLPLSPNKLFQGDGFLLVCDLALPWFGEGPCRGEGSWKIYKQLRYPAEEQDGIVGTPCLISHMPGPRLMKGSKEKLRCCRLWCWPPVPTGAPIGGTMQP